MPAEIVAVIAGSIHCGENCDCRAAMSPMNVEIALTVACRLILSLFGSRPSNYIVSKSRVYIEDSVI